MVGAALARRRSTTSPSCRVRRACTRSKARCPTSSRPARRSKARRFRRSASRPAGVIDRGSDSRSTGSTATRCADASTVAAASRGPARRRGNFDVDAQGLAISDLRPGVEGRVSAKGSIAGTGLTATAPWTARLASMSGTLFGRPADRPRRDRHRDGNFDLRNVRIANGESFVDVDGRVGATALDLKWNLRPALARDRVARDERTPGLARHGARHAAATRRLPAPRACGTSRTGRNHRVARRRSRHRHQRPAPLEHRRSARTRSTARACRSILRAAASKASSATTAST